MTGYYPLPQPLPGSLARPYNNNVRTGHLPAWPAPDLSLGTRLPPAAPSEISGQWADT